MARVKEIGSINSTLLSKPIPEDAFLSEIGGRFPSHEFLRRSTQAVFARQVEYLAALLRASQSLDPGNINVLDWGCGKGHITYLLRQRRFIVTSCDILSSHDDSAFGQQTPILQELGVRVVPLEDAVRLPFPDRSFDCVVSFGVLEHVQSDAKSLVEVRRVLKPGGLLFVVFLPYFLSWTQAVARARGDSYHDRLYSRKDIQRLVEKSGFSAYALRHAQLFPKNSVPLKLDRLLEPVDRFLCGYTPLKYLATNLELVMAAPE